jgi:hypothetical protein
MTSFDNSILVVGIAGKVIGFDARTGAELWRNELPGGYDTVELLIGAGWIIAASSGNSITAIDYHRGHTLWTAQHPLPVGSVHRPILLTKGGLLFLAKGGELACFSLQGTLLWHSELKGLGRGHMSMGFPGNVRQADEER